MAVKITEYLRPTTLKEAVGLLKEHGRSALVLGGGVSVVLSGSPRPMRAVDLSRLGLDRIVRSPGAVRIGATVSLETLIDSEDLARIHGGLIPEACRTAATKPVRDLITVGGNIVQCYSWSTLPPLLLALEARIILAGTETTREVSAESFFEVHPRRFLQPGEIVTHVEIPIPEAKPDSRKQGEGLRESGAFLKFAKTHNDYAMVNACAVVGVENGLIRKVRLALGALDTLPARCWETEDSLVGKPLEDERARELCREAARNAAVREDFRASADYRRHVAGVYLHRALATAWQRATAPS